MSQYHNLMKELDEQTEKLGISALECKIHKSMAFTLLALEVTKHKTWIGAMFKVAEDQTKLGKYECTAIIQEITQSHGNPALSGQDKIAQFQDALGGAVRNDSLRKSLITQLFDNFEKAGIAIIHNQTKMSLKGAATKCCEEALSKNLHQTQKASPIVTAILDEFKRKNKTTLAFQAMPQLTQHALHTKVVQSMVNLNERVPANALQNMHDDIVKSIQTAKPSKQEPITVQDQIISKTQTMTLAAAQWSSEYKEAWAEAAKIILADPGNEKNKYMLAALYSWCNDVQPTPGQITRASLKADQKQDESLSLSF